MLAKRIIPCLDVAGGRVVKGVHFVDLKMREILSSWEGVIIEKAPMNWFSWTSRPRWRSEKRWWIG